MCRTTGILTKSTKLKIKTPAWIKRRRFLLAIFCGYAILDKRGEWGGCVVSKMVVIAFPHGLHVRPAAALVSACRVFDADVTLRFNDSDYNLKSVLGIVGAGVKCGDSIELICSGAQEVEAMEALLKILEDAALTF